MTTAPDPEPIPTPPPAPAKRGWHRWRNWGDHPVVAVVTVLASILAIVGFVMDRASRSTAIRCVDMVGRWDWLSTGGVVAIGEDRKMYWYRVATDPVPTINGTWECDDDRPRQISFAWIQTGFLDTLVLSEDGQRLAGANRQTGFKLSATRSR
jgi:hypothetical protein